MAITYAKDIPDLIEKIKEYGGGGASDATVYKKLSVYAPANYQGVVTVKYWEDDTVEQPTSTYEYGWYDNPLYNGSDINVDNCGLIFRNKDMSGSFEFITYDQEVIFNNSIYYKKDNPILLTASSGTGATIDVEFRFKDFDL